MLEQTNAETSQKGTISRCYVEGPHGIRIPMKEVFLEDTRLPDGSKRQNGTVKLYDTSGAWGDPEFHADPTKGIPEVRKDWIEGRQDVEPEVARIPGWRPTRRAKSNRAVTQLAYARAGIITPEMEYVALRENQGLQDLMERFGPNSPREGRFYQAPGQSYGANIQRLITPEFVREEIARGRAVIPANINHTELEPMIIGRNFLVKINANLGNSALASSIPEEIEK
ncbi:MAG: hypothetical protein RL318_2678, partial [Fibrobacterota bacterium]